MVTVGYSDRPDTGMHQIVVFIWPLLKKLNLKTEYKFVAYVGTGQNTRTLKHLPIADVLLRANYTNFLQPEPFEQQQRTPPGSEQLTRFQRSGVSGIQRFHSTYTICIHNNVQSICARRIIAGRIIYLRILFR